MAYDRADWHYGGDYPADLLPENAGTHIGMFIAWAINHDLEGDLHREDSAASVEFVRQRLMTGREFLLSECDEKFWEEDLNDQGNAFAGWYYASEGPYMQDYERTLAADLESVYHVADTWENYDKLAVVIDGRFDEWRRANER